MSGETLDLAAATRCIERERESVDGWPVTNIPSVQIADARAATDKSLAALIAEVERLREAVQDADDARHDALLIAEAWEVEAGRYRFLRDNPLGFRAVDGAASVPPHPDVMDRWVDAALAAREAAHD